MADRANLSSDLVVEREGDVAWVEIQRPPHNFFDADLLSRLADQYDRLANGRCRAIVLASQGKSFCAGADHGGETGPTVSPVAAQAMRLFRSKLPVIACVQGGATGGGMGLALSADFRVVSSEARFWPNFAQLGFHAGFGISASLPRLVGAQRAQAILLTGQRINGEDAVSLGLADRLVAPEDLRAAALTLAREVAAGAPLAVQSMRETLRRDFVDEVERVMERELLLQTAQRTTEDFRRGVRAMRERRTPNFVGR